jgi:hypothetical protein
MSAVQIRIIAPKFSGDDDCEISKLEDLNYDDVKLDFRDTRNLSNQEQIQIMI